MTFENEGVLKELLFQKNPVKPIIEVEAHLSAKLMCFDLFYLDIGVSIPDHLQSMSFMKDNQP
ncbi:hypothetical protein ABG775_04610 [Peribacillus simplex]|uniref:hypothetical protein n=1 Tax=Peribacillus TaxID=2675229 RepID=UPI001783E1C2|nr:hypothetical protein [Brevibacillus sp. JNUCC-41]QOS92520.1 hypothetical protein JNUCC41_13350 [Brevibacillus sp. JNUCC-41]